MRLRGDRRRGVPGLTPDHVLPTVGSKELVALLPLLLGLGPGDIVVHLFRPEVRAAYAELIDQGWTDSLRALHPGERIYTFWDYFRNAFGRNAGLRIDHLLLNPALSPRLKAAGVDRFARAREKPSDHAPTWIELADPPRRKVKPAA